MYRQQLEAKRKQRVDAEKRVGELRTKESQKRTAAAKARQDAARSKSPSTISQKLRDAERCEREAASAGDEAARWQSRATGYARDEATLQGNLARAERTEAEERERARVRVEREATRRAAADRAALLRQIDSTATRVSLVVHELRAPKPERLRVLILGAASEGDLRVGREQSRISTAVRHALHRDRLELDVRPSATTGDLLDGIGRFRPHVVHFSGHSNRDLIVFEDDVDEPNSGVVVKAEVFARALAATDEPPLLVLLNACESAPQAEALVDGGTVPFAIGMSDEIDDVDAINYAAQFYASVANGQSIASAHAAGCVALELAGLAGSDLPVLFAAPDADAASVCLVSAVDEP